MTKFIAIHKYKDGAKFYPGLMLTLKSGLDIERSMQEIVKLLIDLYDYAEDEAIKYAENLRDKAYEESAEEIYPNSTYVKNKLNKKIESLKTGIDIEANIVRLGLRLGKIVEKAKENLDRAEGIEIKIGGDKMQNTVEARNNPNYKMHVLVKYECLECEKSFILSKKFVDDLKGIDVSCPYCGNYNVEDTVIMDDQDSLDELGCLGIGHLEDEEEMEESSMVVMKKAYLFKPEGVDSTVVTKKELIHGAKEEDFKEITLCIDIDTMREWATEQRIIDQEEDYEVIDDRY